MRSLLWPVWWCSALLATAYRCGGALVSTGTITNRTGLRKGLSELAWVLNEETGKYERIYKYDKTGFPYVGTTGRTEIVLENGTVTVRTDELQAAVQYKVRDDFFTCQEWTFPKLQRIKGRMQTRRELSGIGYYAVFTASVEDITIWVRNRNKRFEWTPGARKREAEYRLEQLKLRGQKETDTAS